VSGTLRRSKSASFVISSIEGNSPFLSIVLIVAFGRSENA
jgi:hypothetical protein